MLIATRGSGIFIYNLYSRHLLVCRHDHSLVFEASMDAECSHFRDSMVEKMNDVLEIAAGGAVSVVTAVIGYFAGKKKQDADVANTLIGSTKMLLEHWQLTVDKLEQKNSALEKSVAALTLENNQLKQKMNSMELAIANLQIKKRNVTKL